MTATDPVILTAYLLCLAFFIYKIIDAFNDEFEIKLLEKSLDKDGVDKEEKDGGLEEQLERLGLQDILKISFKFDKRYEFDKLKKLSINIENKSTDHAIYVDWDYSALTDEDGKARRVARVVPGNTIDLANLQPCSAIAPKTTLKEEIAAEDQIKRKGDDKSTSPVALELEVKEVMIKLGEPAKTAPDAAKTRWKEFMRRVRKRTFSLDLALRLAQAQMPADGRDRYRLRCKFILTKLPWQAGLPFNPKK
jgi:hypothetical protein